MAGFHWTDVDENATNWTFEEYAEGMDGREGEEGRGLWGTYDKEPLSQRLFTVS